MICLLVLAKCWMHMNRNLVTIWPCGDIHSYACTISFIVGVCVCHLHPWLARLFLLRPWQIKLVHVICYSCIYHIWHACFRLCCDMCCLHYCCVIAHWLHTCFCLFRHMRCSPICSVIDTVCPFMACLFLLAPRHVLLTHVRCLCHLFAHWWHAWFWLLSDHCL